MKLLIDADFIVYKCCAAAEDEIDWGEDVVLVTSRFSEAYKAVLHEIMKIRDEFGNHAEPILFFSHYDNFRKKIFPEYKGHRNRKKPCGYKKVISMLHDDYHVVILPELEADDGMGIYATKYPGNVIVSPDKDMRQIPGLLYDFKEYTTITEEDGLHWHYIQTLAGDATDGYSGCPGIGVKRAVTLFEKTGYNWKTIKDAFAAKDLDEDMALMNARLAKILTKDYYDDKRRVPILWSPETDNGIDNGTGSSDEGTV